MPGSLVPVFGIWLCNNHEIVSFGFVPATSARGLPDLYGATAADRTDALPRPVRARPIAGGDGDRLLRFPGIAGSDLRRRPRRTVRGAQRRQSGAGVPA